MRLLALAAAVLAAAATPARRYHPNPLLVSFEEGLEAKERYRFPFASKYSDGHKRLVYVAGDHTTGVDDPNLRTVKAMFDELRPQAVLVEGFRSFGDRSLRDLDVDAFAKDGFKSAAESPYAVYLAVKAGLPARGGEPMDREAMEQVSTQEGFFPLDVLAFFAVRMVPSWRRDGEIPDDKALQAKLEGFLADKRDELHLKEPFGAADLEQWFRRHNPRAKTLREVQYEDLRPYYGAGARPLERLSYALDQAREARFLSQLESLLTRYDRVLVVYGGSHLCRERRMLQDLLGKPVDVKPF